MDDARTPIPAADPAQGAKTRVERAIEEVRAAAMNALDCGVDPGELGGILGRGGISLGNLDL